MNIETKQKFDFLIHPYKHQLKAVEAASVEKDLALFFEQGTGKTGAAINILRWHYTFKSGGVCRTLILGPLVVLENWKREFALWSRINKHCIFTITGTLKKRAATLELATTGVTKDSNIIIMNYEAIQSEELYDMLIGWSPEILICDESHLLKNYKSIRAKRIVHLADKAQRRFILTGTPILQSAADIWMQFRILDRGATFGDKHWGFHNTYFYDANSSWANKPNHFPRWLLREDLAEELHNKIYRKAIRVLKKDCLDLPPLIKQTVYVPLGTEQARAYKQMKEEFLTWIDTQKGESAAVVATLAMTKALRLQQIASGYAKTDTGEEIFFQDNPREDECARLLDDLTPYHKVIVWASFTANYKTLEKICGYKNIKYVMLTGEQDQATKQQSIDSFQNDETVRVIIANRRAGGIGVNLTAASYSIIYSRNFSLGEEEQSEARNYRSGSERHESIVRIDLAAEHTIDEHVLDALRDKKELSASIVELRRLL